MAKDEVYVTGAGGRIELRFAGELSKKMRLWRPTETSPSRDRPVLVADGTWSKTVWGAEVGAGSVVVAMVAAPDELTGEAAEMYFVDERTKRGEILRTSRLTSEGGPWLRVDVYSSAEKPLRVGYGWYKHFSGIGVVHVGFSGVGSPKEDAALGLRLETDLTNLVRSIRVE